MYRFYHTTISPHTLSTLYVHIYTYIYIYMSLEAVKKKTLCIYISKIHILIPVGITP